MSLDNIDFESWMVAIGVALVVYGLSGYTPSTSRAANPAFSGWHQLCFAAGAACATLGLMNRSRRWR